MTWLVAALYRCALQCVTVLTTGPRHFFTLKIKQTVNKYVICQEVIGLIRETKHRKGLEKAGQRLPVYVGGQGLRLEEATCEQRPQGSQAVSHLEKSIPGAGAAGGGPEAGGRCGGS